MARSEPTKCKICGNTEFHRVCFPPEKRSVATTLKAVSDRGLPISKGPAQMKKKAKKKSAPKQRRQAGVSASKPARDSSRKTDDEVSGAQETHGQSSGPQQPSKTEFDRNAYQREYMRERRAAKRLGLTLEEFRKLEGPTS